MAIGRIGERATDGRAMGRAKNSARPGVCFELSLVRAGFEPFLEAGSSRNCDRLGHAHIDARSSKKHPDAPAQNRRDLAERDMLSIGAPSFSPTPR